MDWGGEDTDGGKDGGWNIEEQVVCHLFGSGFVLRHEKLFSVGKLVQRVPVSLDHHELFHL